MQYSVRESRSLASRQAEDLLRAWVSGEPAKVNAELEHSISLPFAPCDTGEEERRHMLQAVAGRMRRCPDLFASRSRDGVLEVCVRLLSHLVSTN
jgi:hypothetical protein